MSQEVAKIFPKEKTAYFTMVALGVYSLYGYFLDPFSVILDSGHECRCFLLLVFKLMLMSLFLGKVFPNLEVAVDVIFVNLFCNSTCLGLHEGMRIGALNYCSYSSITVTNYSLLMSQHLADFQDGV